MSKSLPSSFVILKPSDWKRALAWSLAHEGRSRHSFAREVEEAEILSLYSAETLLSEGARGDREPKFSAAIEMARLAGFEFVMVKSKNPATLQAHGRRKTQR